LSFGVLNRFDLRVRGEQGQILFLHLSRVVVVENL
jgi:hypothetical protein